MKFIFFNNEQTINIYTMNSNSLLKQSFKFVIVCLTLDKSAGVSGAHCPYPQFSSVFDRTPIKASVSSF